jgi:hypothetical protein
MDMQSENDRIQDELDRYRGLNDEIKQLKVR